jgi:hypothetical protein
LNYWNDLALVRQGSLFSVDLDLARWYSCWMGEWAVKGFFMGNGR